MEEYNRYIDNIEIPKGIGKNESLKENVFVIIVMILNKIPLFITGKPGSSKTLAMNLVLKTMKGQSSNNDFFKQLPAVMPFYYQGSVQSTSTGIDKIFERAFKTNEAQQKKLKNENQVVAQQLQNKNQNVIVVVIIDEIGLAEISPHNPLKVLHAYLEMFTVAFVGISNYCLDASKQNRGLTLQKPEPDDADLVQAATSLSEDINGDNYDIHNKFVTYYIDRLVRFYLDYYNKQSVINFHGLRDFYQMISQICFQKKASEEGLLTLIINSVGRNFGGNSKENVMEFLYNELNEQGTKQMFVAKESQILIKENILDLRARNLMIISNHLEIVNVRFIEQVCSQLGRTYKIFYGSEFEKDKQEEAIYRIIQDIITCMETGEICILMNLDNIYQAFYDMLNQNYQEINKQKYCKVAIGPDSTRCVVHPSFRCVILSHIRKVSEMDPPFLNRFEKHIYNEYDSLSQQQMQLIKKLQVWMMEIGSVNNKFSYKDMFTVLVYNEQQLTTSLTSLVLMVDKLDIQEENYESFCKEQIIGFSNQLSILRCLQSQATDSYEWYNAYNCQQKHDDIKQLINHYQEIWKTENMLDQSQNGFNLVVYTFSANTRVIFDKKDKLIDDTPIIMSSITSKDELQSKIQKFFNSFYGDTTTKLIIADQQKDSLLTIQLCKSLINQTRMKYQQKSKEKAKQKNFVIIVKIKENYNSNIYFTQGWKELFIDLTNGLGNSNIHQDYLLNTELLEIIENKKVFTELLGYSLKECMSKIKYMRFDREQIEERINQILSLILENDLVYKTFMQIFISQLQVSERLNEINKSWQNYIAQEKNIINCIASFHGAALNFFRTLILKYYTYTIYELEENCLVDHLIEREQNVQAQLLDMFKADFERRGFQNINYKAGNNYIVHKSYIVKQFPYFNKIYQILKDSEPIIKKEIEHSVKQEKLLILQFQNLQERLQLYQEKLDSFKKGEEKYKNEEFTDEEDNGQNIRKTIGGRDHIKNQDEINQQDDDNIFELENEQEGKIVNQVKQKLSLSQVEEKVGFYQDQIQNEVTQIQNNYEMAKPDLDGMLESISQSLNIYLSIEEIDLQLFWQNICLKVSNNDDISWIIVLTKILFTRDPETLNPIDQYIMYVTHQAIISEIVIILKNFQSIVKVERILELMHENIQQYRNQNSYDMLSLEFYPQYVIFDSFIKAFTRCIQPSEDLFQQLKEENLQYEDMTSQILQSLMFLNPFKRSEEIQKIQFYQSYKQRILNLDDSKNLNELIEIAEKVQNIQDPRLIIMKILGIEENNDDNVIQEDEYKVNEQELEEEQEEERKSEETISDKANSSNGSNDESEREVNDEQYLMCCFIFQYLEHEFPKVRKTKQESFMKFVIQTLSYYITDIKSEPLIAQGLLKWMIIMMNKQYGGIELFTCKLIINYDRTISNSKNSIIRFVNQLLEGDKKLFDVENPIIVLLCDLIEQQIEHESENIQTKQFDENLVRSVLNCAIDSNNPIIQRISAIANVRHILKHVSTNLVLAYKNKKPPVYEKYLKIIDQYFSSSNFDKIKPLIIYVLKNINDQIDFNFIIKELETENQRDKKKYQWILNILTKDVDEQVFTILLDVQVVMNVQDQLAKGLNQKFEERYVQKWENKPTLKYLVGLAIYQFHFLQKQHDIINLNQYIENFTGKNVLDQSILKRIIQRDFSAKQHQYLYENRSQLERELLGYTINTCLQSNPKCYFAHLFRNPIDIGNLFLPFNLNHEDDITYFTFKKMYDAGDDSLTTFQVITKYQCKNQNCKAPFFLTECGNIQNYRNNGDGASICELCGHGKGYGFHNNEDKIYVKSLLEDFENESQKSYIFATFHEYSNIPYPTYKLRDLGIINLYLGQIIQHLIILSSYLIQEEDMQNKIIKLYGDPQVKADHLNQFINDQLQNLRKYTQNLQEQLQINEQKLIIIIETILQRIFQTSAENRISKEQVTNIQGRKVFERYFQDYIIQFHDTQEINDFLRQTQPSFMQFQDISKQDMQNQIQETIDIDEIEYDSLQHQMPSLLRSQGQPSFENFKLQLQNNKNNECQFIKTIISKKDIILNISHLKHFLDWIHFVFDHFNSKISFEDSQKLKIDNVLRKLNDEDYKKGSAIFQDFQESWNYLRDRLEMVDGCDRVKFAEINEESTFSICCITSKKKDNAGIYFYYLLVRLGLLQNHIIKSVSEITGYEILKIQIEKPLSFMSLRDYQIMTEKLDVEFITNEMKNYSQNKLVYGEGKNVLYNTKKLADILFSKIFQNKAFIEVDDESDLLEFIYENLTNPINQYDDIQAKIRQVSQNQNFNIKQQLGSSEDRRNLLLEIQTAMNYLQHVGGDPTQYLTDFMKAFKITRYIEHVGQGVQLQHILDYYEHIEMSLETKLVERCRPEFQQQLTGKQIQDFKKLIKSNIDKLDQLKTILGRLIIRQLSDSSPFSNKEYLILYIFENADLNRYLFGIDQEVNVQSYLRVFKNSDITLAQAFYTHQLLLVIKTKNERKKRRLLEEKERQNQELAMKQQAEDEERKENLKDITGQNGNVQQAPNIFGAQDEIDYDEDKYKIKIEESKQKTDKKVKKVTKKAGGLFGM